MFNQNLEEYAKRKNTIQRRFLDNTRLNQQLVRTSRHSAQDRVFQKNIKIRELKHNSLPYIKHMRWLNHPYGG